jgi:hypothetical protein
MSCWLFEYCILNRYIENYIQKQTIVFHQLELAMQAWIRNLMPEEHISQTKSGALRSPSESRTVPGEEQCGQSPHKLLTIRYILYYGTSIIVKNIVMSLI